MKSYTVTANGNAYEVTIEEGVFTGAAPVARAVALAPKTAPAAALKAAPVGAADSVVVLVPISSKILGIKAAVGQAVKKGDVVVVLEVMRMENEIVTSSDGIVAGANASVGDSVEVGATLVTLN